VNELVHRYHPGVLMIAEESTSFPSVTRPPSQGGLGFDYKWNMGWMHDTLEYFSKEPLYRRWHQNDLTFGMLYQYAENFVSVFSHDEVVHGKASMLYKMGAWHIPEKAANLRALYAHMWAYPGKKLLFMGSEWAQSGEWNHTVSLDWHLCKYMDHEGVRRLVIDLNRLYVAEQALGSNDFNPQGFRWINCTDADANVIVYLRTGANEETLFVVVGHFGGVTRRFRVGVPRIGWWREVINSNSEYYGGSGLGNDGGRTAANEPRDGYTQSIELTLPPLTTLVFKWSAGG
jgi:1,4-alpha-glucan branching enzyme